MTSRALFLATTALLLHSADAHGRMTTLRAGGATASVRGGGGSNGGTENAPVPGNTSPKFICRNAKKAPEITITAGSTMEVRWDFSAAHVGDCALYLSYDDTNYFKIANFPECNLDNREFVTVQLPAWLPNGVAVVRWDWYALHQSPSAELYSQCTDVTVAGSNGAVTKAAVNAIGYSPINPPIYPMRSGSGGTYRQPFNRRAPFFMTGPDCVGGVTGNCCDLSAYKYGSRYADCAATGASTGAPPAGVGSGGGATGGGGGVPTPAPTPAKDPCVSYTVVAGDTLGAIAATFTRDGDGAGGACPVTSDDIAEFNGIIERPDEIDIGETFIVPCPSNCCTDGTCTDSQLGGSSGSSGSSSNVQQQGNPDDPAGQAKRDAESKLGSLKVAVGLLSTVIVGLIAVIYKSRRGSTATTWSSSNGNTDNQGIGMKSTNSWLKPGTAGTQGII